MANSKKPKTYPSLKAWRRAWRLTQIQAAHVLGVSQGQYSRLENGTRFPRRIQAKAISERARVPLEVVLGL